jgi:hypothetical protein
MCGAPGARRKAFYTLPSEHAAIRPMRSRNSAPCREQQLGILQVTLLMDPNRQMPAGGFGRCTGSTLVAGMSA